MENDDITPGSIIDLVISHIVLSPGGWEKVLRDVDNELQIIWQIHLGTKLEEA